MKHIMVSLIAACALTAGACSNTTDTSASTLPTTPTAPATVENFSGTVQVGGSDSNPFTVVTSGNPINLTLTSAGPPATIFMGFGVGSFAGTTCQLLSGGFLTTQAGPAAQLSGNIGSGQFCVMVYDVGNQSAPITYTVVITHY